MTRVSPNFNYQGSVWAKAIDTWFNSDVVEIDYIQTLLGLFLTGETRDECVAMWTGKSGAGKSKMTDIMSHIMGDYAQAATDTAFLEVRYHPHQEEIARMQGKRLIMISEVEGHLNLRRVKSIASGEETSASFKGKDSFQFKPVAKIWFVGNESPPTKSSGRELQRRFHVYEFVREIADKDMDINLGTKLRAEAELVLGWVIHGAKKYYDTGLHRSPHAILSTDKYFADADILEQWKSDCCVVDPSAITTVAALYVSFGYWADEAGVKFKPDKGRFSQRLKAKGFILERRVVEKGQCAVRVVVGLRLYEEESRF
jgi:putative DNA primase/helicase